MVLNHGLGVQVCFTCFQVREAPMPLAIVLGSWTTGIITMGPWTKTNSDVETNARKLRVTMAGCRPMAIPASFVFPVIETASCAFALHWMTIPKKHQVTGKEWAMKKENMSLIGWMENLVHLHSMGNLLGTFIEGSLEVKLPTIWRDEKAVSRDKSQKRKDQKERRCRCAKR